MSPSIHRICIPTLHCCTRVATDTTDAGQTDASRGNLNVAGLPLLDEDIDVIVHVRDAIVCQSHVRLHREMPHPYATC